MTTGHKVTLGVCLILVLALGFLGYSWAQMWKAQVMTEAKVEAISQAQQVRTQKDQAQQQQAQTAKAAVKTSSDAVKVITQYVPVKVPSGQPAAIETTRPELSTTLQQELPNSASYTVMTQEQSVGVGQALIQCRADYASLQVCKQNYADEQQKTVAYQKLSGQTGNWFVRLWNKEKFKIGIAIGATATAAIAKGVK